MAELLKQLKIKTSMLKRLRKQYESYNKQIKSIQLKIANFQSTHAQDEQTLLLIKKNQQFLTQSQSVSSNVKQKLIEAFEGLASFLQQKGEDQQINTAEEKGIAQNLVLQTETYLQSVE